MSDLDSTAPEGVDATEVAEETTAELGPVAIEDMDGDDADAAEPEDSDEGGERDDPADDEEIEIDFGGNKAKFKANVPAKEVAAQVQEFAKSLWGDYTRKSQAVAEQTKSIAARTEAVAKLESLNGDALSEYSKGLQIRSELDRLHSIDLNALWQSNPDQARRVSDHKANLAAQFNETINRVEQIETGMTRAQEAEMARLATEGETRLEKRVKGFSQKVPEIIDYVASTYGIDKSHAEKVWKMDPATAEMAYKSMMYDRMQSKAAKPQAKPQQASPLTPMKAAGSVSHTSRDLSKVDMDTYVALRRKGIGA